MVGKLYDMKIFRPEKLFHITESFSYLVVQLKGVKTTKEKVHPTFSLRGLEISW